METAYLIARYRTVGGVRSIVGATFASAPSITGPLEVETEVAATATAPTYHDASLALERYVRESPRLAWARPFVLRR